VGRHSQAREHITVCTTMYRELDMPFWLGQAERALEAGGT
jgi:hypothetical protein